MKADDRKEFPQQISFCLFRLIFWENLDAVIVNVYYNHFSAQ